MNINRNKRAWKNTLQLGCTINQNFIEIAVVDNTVYCNFLPGGATMSKEKCVCQNLKKINLKKFKYCGAVSSPVSCPGLYIILQPDCTWWLVAHNRLERLLYKPFGTGQTLWKNMWQVIGQTICLSQSIMVKFSTTTRASWSIKLLLKRVRRGAKTLFPTRKAPQMAC